MTVVAMAMVTIKVDVAVEPCGAAAPVLEAAEHVLCHLETGSF